MFDIHCHILFGVDDGSRSMQESISMLHAAKKQGIDRIMCTPHCRWDSWDPALIRHNFEKLENVARQYGISLDLGHEVYWQKLLEIGIEHAPELTLGDTNLFLLELSTSEKPARFWAFLELIQQQGLQVVIAHPERYRYVQNDLGFAKELKDRGCYLQLSANFISASLLDPSKRTATALLENDLVDYLASDAHRPADYEVYKRALAYCQKF